MDLRDLEEAVAVVANHLQLVEHLLLEVAPALELVEALLPTETERAWDSWQLIESCFSSSYLLKYSGIPRTLARHDLTMQ